ncbi:MAG TPA: dipeptidase [Deinococcales bacterium]|nr:dipeptidase [Deinococcales bacterium]
MSGLSDALASLEQLADGAVGDLLEFVRIPSVSADPAHAGDMADGAAWLQSRLERAGFPEVHIHETVGHPVVVARWHPHAAAPTVLVYGHYDVQPPDPLSEWDSPPFEPEIRDGKLYGRGASDDKGGVITALLAIEAAVAASGVPPVNLTLLIEGEEETGSPSLPAFLEQNRELLAADVALSADGVIFDVGRPSLTLASRGVVDLEIAVRGANRDLHSGMYGGIVANPALALSRILSSLQDPDGVVLVQGFHDGIPELGAAERTGVAAMPYAADEAQRLGLDGWWGDPAFAPAERRLLRPTLEVNGLWSGYQGPGSKTVIPAEAFAKITCRLVEGQDPDAVLDGLRRHILAVVPPGVTVELQQLGGGAAAYTMPPDLPLLDVARRSLQETFGVEPVVAWEGGTIPIAASIRNTLGIWFLFYAFGEPDNLQHAPNEFYRVGMLEQGAEATVRLLYDLAAGAEIQ